MKIRLMHDWLLVELEPLRERTRSGLIRVDPQPVRIARVLDMGPGRRDYTTDAIVPLDLKIGDRFPFFKAVTETMQGERLSHYVDDNQALIKESDVLFIIEEGDPEISV